MDHLDKRITCGKLYKMKNRRRFLIFHIIFITVLILTLFDPVPCHCQGWSDLTIRLLPDSSFAVIEVDENGKKYRRCPYRDANGKLYEEQLIFVLGAFDKGEWLFSENKEKARKHLEKHYEKFITRVMKKDIKSPVNICEASLTELVPLPNIGPVLAVRIVEYRNTHPCFETIEDVKKVDGIGYRTFNAIRHYISVD